MVEVLWREIWRILKRFPDGDVRDEVMTGLLGVYVCGFSKGYQMGLYDGGWMYEDDLPEDMTDQEYNDWFKESQVIDGVRMGPVVDHES